MKRLLATSLLLLSALTGQAQSAIRAYIDNLNAGEPFQSAVWGVLAVRLNGDTLVAYNHLQKMLPASNVKLITTGAALQALGSDYRYTTSLAYSGQIRGGILEGDLYIIGGGDPTLGAKDDFVPQINSTFAQWKSLLDQAGITEIRGTVIGDGRSMAHYGENLSWCYEDLGFSYGACPVGLNFYKNTQDFTVGPGEKEGDPASIVPFFPEMPWMIVTNRSTTAAKGKGDGLQYVTTELGPYAEMRGYYALEKPSKVEGCTNKYPAYTCAYYFHNYLMANGIPVGDAFADISPDGRIRQDMILLDEGRPAAARESLTHIGETSSPALTGIIRETLVRSDNFYAESLLRSMGMQKSGRDDYDGSLAAEDAILRSMGLDTSYGVQLVDGSGLSRKNYVSPDFFVRFLTAMAQGPHYRQYLNALPQPGRGTLAARLPQMPEDTRRRIYMKSGSMNGTRCYSGYVVPTDGKTENTIVFSVLTNNVSGPSSKMNAILDKIITLIAK